MKNKWIWFWYNDVTRLCILSGIPSVIVTAIAFLIFGPGEYLRNVAIFSYIGLFGWAIMDNDYSNLRKIGLDEYRNKISEK